MRMREFVILFYLTRWADAPLVVLITANLIGAIVIISILEPYFRKSAAGSSWHLGLSFVSVIAVGCLAIGYKYFAAFYSESAREMKRLGNYLHLLRTAQYWSRTDSMLRAFLYAHFAESLSGLPTIRSYGEINRFINDNKYYTDLEDRAALLTTTNQRFVLAVFERGYYLLVE